MDREVPQPTSAVPDIFKVANLNAARGGQGRPRLPRPISKVTSRSDDARPGRATGPSQQVRWATGTGNFAGKKFAIPVCPRIPAASGMNTPGRS